MSKTRWVILGVGLSFIFGPSVLYMLGLYDMRPSAPRPPSAAMIQYCLEAKIEFARQAGCLSGELGEAVMEEALKRRNIRL